MKILFLHGWHAVPGGVKPIFLPSTAMMSSTPNCRTMTSPRPSGSPRTSSTSTSRDVVVGSIKGWCSGHQHEQRLGQARASQPWLEEMGNGQVPSSLAR